MNTAEHRRRFRKWLSPLLFLAALMTVCHSNAAQPFTLFSTEPSSGWWEIRFQGPHKLYEIQTSGDLIAWQPLSQFWPIGTNYSQVVPLTAAEKFFRVRRISPLNDDFVDRLQLFGSIIEVDVSLWGATHESGEPDFQGNGWTTSDYQTIWFQWVAPANGIAVFSVDNTNNNFHVNPSLYRGTNLSNLQYVDSTLNASIEFSAVSNTTYQFSASGYATYPATFKVQLQFSIPPLVSLLQPTNGNRSLASGPITFAADATDPDGFIKKVEFITAGGAIHQTVTNAPWSVTLTNIPSGFWSVQAIATDNLNVQSETDYVDFTVAPPNDDFARRIPLAGTNLTFRASNVGSSREPNEPFHHNVFGTNSVWWSWTAPITGVATVSTIPTGVYDILAVYTGTPLASLVEVGSAVDSAGNAGAVVSFNATAGTEYQIVIDSRAATGSVTMGSVRGSLEIH